MNLPPAQPELVDIDRVLCCRRCGSLLDYGRRQSPDSMRTCVWCPALRTGAAVALRRRAARKLRGAAPAKGGCPLMSRPPAYDRAIFTPAGPRRLRCMVCSCSISSNALARAAHERSLQHQERMRQIQERRARGLGYMQRRGAS